MKKETWWAFGFTIAIFLVFCGALFWRGYLTLAVVALFALFATTGGIILARMFSLKRMEKEIKKPVVEKHEPKPRKRKR